MKKKSEEEEVVDLSVKLTKEGWQKLMAEEKEEISVAPLELTGGLNVTREEFNLVVAKLNELIRKN